MKSMKSNENQWNPMKSMKSNEINEIQWKSMKSNENQWNPMKNGQNQWKSMDFKTHPKSLDWKPQNPIDPIQTGWIKINGIHRKTGSKRG
jgi:hypothetical protein